MNPIAFDIGYDSMLGVSVSTISTIPVGGVYSVFEYINGTYGFIDELSASELDNLSSQAAFVVGSHFGINAFNQPSTEIDGVPEQPIAIIT